MNLVVLGCGGVGKTAFVVQYIQQQFLDFYDPTIIDNYEKQETVDGETTLLHIVDTAGQQEFASMITPYIKAGEGFMIMYSVTDRNSFVDVERFVKQVKQTKDLSVFPCVLVGNKIDLAREVKREEGERKAASFFSAAQGTPLAAAMGVSIPHIEVSAKNYTNINEAWAALVRQVRLHRDVLSGKTVSSPSALAQPTSPPQSSSPAASPQERSAPTRTQASSPGTPPPKQSNTASPRKKESKICIML